MTRTLKKIHFLGCFPTAVLIPFGPSLPGLSSARVFSSSQDKNAKARKKENGLFSEENERKREKKNHTVEIEKKRGVGEIYNFEVSARYMGK